MELRQCTSDDYDFCFDLYKTNMISYTEKHWDGWEDTFFTKNFNIDKVKIIEEDGKPIGFYEIGDKGELGILYDIQITKEYQNKGIGKRIMHDLEEEFRIKGVKAIKLRVFVDNPVISLYSKLGYKEIKKSNSVATIVMEKEL